MSRQSHSPRLDTEHPLRRKCLVLAMLAVQPAVDSFAADDIGKRPTTLPVIGVSAAVVEQQTGVRLPARIDTGAASCALHVEEYLIEDEAESMAENIGKPVRVRIRDGKGDLHWIDSEVADVAWVKNPSTRKRQQRYKVWLDLEVAGEEARVKVAITDRRHMRYPVLLGRNFLAGRFLIDPSRDGV